VTDAPRGDVLLQSTQSVVGAGVPRVFTEHELPAKLRDINTAGVMDVDEMEMQGCRSVLEAAVQASTKQILATLQQCRVNVSIRHTGPQTAYSGCTAQK
jgi:hypothetical protein